MQKLFLACFKHTKLSVLRSTVLALAMSTDLESKYAKLPKVTNINDSDHALGYQLSLHNYTYLIIILMSYIF